MAGRSRTIESELSFNSGSIYFDFEPGNKDFGIAHVQKVTDNLFLDIDRRNGEVLGIEIPFSSVRDRIHRSTLKRIHRRRAKLSLNKLYDIVSDLVTQSPNQATNQESADLALRKIVNYNRASGKPV